MNIATIATVDQLVKSFKPTISLSFGEFTEWLSNVEKTRDFLLNLNKSQYVTVLDISDNPNEVYLLLLLYSEVMGMQFTVDSINSTEFMNRRREIALRHMIDDNLNDIEINFEKIFIAI